MPLKVSIIITTRNRAGHLRKTLASLNQLHVPEDLPSELLVVDNASTDGTSDVVKTTRLSGLSMRYLHEPKPGQSNARNSGMANTTGQVILFTDDDVRVPMDWVEKMSSPILTGEAEAVAGGIRMAPNLKRPWMRNCHEAWLATSNDNWSPVVPTMTGANMAFSRRILERVPLFDPELGPGALGFADDTLFSLQLIETGFKILVKHDTWVEHHFDESRLLRSSWLANAQMRGRVKAYLTHHWLGDGIRHLLFKRLRSQARLAAWRCANPHQVFRREGCAEEELRMVRSVSFHKQFVVERRRPRAYGPRGIVKKETKPWSNKP
jgi:glucosyl-dolichyl phosphate glucuronosyltransferase